MEYGPNEWTGLVAEVERQGGALLPDECRSELIPELSVHHNKAETCGCDNQSKLVSIYEPCDFKKTTGGGPTANDQIKRGSGFVTACAVCDDMGAWPRYEKAVL